MLRRDNAVSVLLVWSSRLRWARSVSTRRISSRAAAIRARAASVSTTGRGVWSMLAAAQPPAFVGVVSGGVQDSRRNRLARALRSGMVETNGVSRGRGSAFGGVKASGRAREGGVWGIEEFMDSKQISGWDADAE